MQHCGYEFIIANRPQNSRRIGCLATAHCFSEQIEKRDHSLMEAGSGLSYNKAEVGLLN
jgi:hypothetical protein